MVFPRNRNTSSPSHHSTAHWTPRLPTASQLAAVSVQPRHPLRQWTAFPHPSLTAPPHTAPPATAWTQQWLPRAISIVSMARVSPTSLNYLICLPMLPNVFNMFLTLLHYTNL